MALSISAYSPNYQSNIDLPTTNLDLVSKVMQFKQTKFDQNFQQLQGFKQSALNIQFLNEERREEINKLNKDLDDRFNTLTNGGIDYSDTNTFNSYISWFDGIKKNTDLIQAYQEDKKWQADLNKVQSLKNSKDPIKAGYSSVNEFVFNKRLNDYSKSKKDNKVEFKGYTPYTDIVGEVTKIYKSLPKKKVTRDTVLPGGRIVTEEIDGYTYEELTNVLGAMTTNMQEQMRVEAEYGLINGMSRNPTAYRENLYDSYNETILKHRTEIDKRLDEAKQKQALSLDSEKESYNTVIQQLEQDKLDTLSGIKSKDWFLTTNESNLLETATQLHAQRKVSGIAKGLESKVSTKYKVDMTYFSNMRLKQSSDQFNATLDYKKRQDYQDNLFKQQKLQIDAADLAIKQAKEIRESGGSTGAQGESSSLFNTGKSYVPNELQNATVTSVNKLEDTIRTRSFNIADGANYNKEFMGRKNQSNDSILETILTMYDDNDMGQSIRTISEYVNKAGLSENISINTLMRALPQLAKDIESLDIKNKVGAVKTTLNRILSGDFNSLNGKYKNFTEDAVIYQNQAQLQQSFLKNKSKYFWEAVKDMPQKDWNKMTPTQQETVSAKMATAFQQSNTLPSFGIQERSYQDIGIKPTKEQQVRYDESVRLARLLRERSNTTFDVPPSVIASVSVVPDGTTIVYFKGEKDFKEALGDNYLDIIRPDPIGFSGEEGFWGDDREAVVKGDKTIPNSGAMKPNGYMIIKTEPNVTRQASSVDKVIAAGNTFTTTVNVGSESKILKLTKVMNDYVYEIDGKRTTLDRYVSDKTPTQVLEVIKKNLQQ